MEEWEDFFIRFCLDSGYISGREVTALMSRINRSKQQNKHQDFLVLFAEELGWTDDQIQSIYLQALKHRKNKPDHDKPKEKSSASALSYGLMAASDLVSPDIVEQQLGQAMSSGTPVEKNDPDRMSRMQARLSGIVSEEVLGQQLSQALNEKMLSAHQSKSPAKIRSGTTGVISKERLSNQISDALSNLPTNQRAAQEFANQPDNLAQTIMGEQLSGAFSEHVPNAEPSRLSRMALRTANILSQDSMGEQLDQAMKSSCQKSHEIESSLVDSNEVTDGEKISRSMEKEKIRQASKARLEQLYKEKEKEKVAFVTAAKITVKKKKKKKKSSMKSLFRLLKVAVFLMIVVSGIFFGKPYFYRFLSKSSIKVEKPVEIPGFKYLCTSRYSCGGVSNKVSEYLHEQTGLEFVLLPGGHFFMGSKHGEAEEKPLHEVTIGPFLISKVEVTQLAWQKIMGSHCSFFQGKNLPVDSVNWEDCQRFCEKTELTLPTEAQWEYACRAGSQTRFYWGQKIDASYLWYRKNAHCQSHPVGKKLPNAFGLYDMLGNVWEWCEDGWSSSYDGASIDGRANNVSSCKGRINRGGSFSDVENFCRSAKRAWMVPTIPYKNLGFRVCVEMD